MAMNVANLFSGFLVEDEAFFILVEFESDRMSLRKSAKSGRPRVKLENFCQF